MSDMDLTNSEILQRCLKGNTQNANESFHSKVWQRICKTKFVSLPSIKYINYIAFSALQHNFGYEKACMLKNITQSAKTKQLQYADKERERHSITPKSKKPRLSKSDATDYAPGSF